MQYTPAAVQYKQLTVYDNVHSARCACIDGLLDHAQLKSAPEGRVKRHGEEVEPEEDLGEVNVRGRRVARLRWRVELVDKLVDQVLQGRRTRGGYRSGSRSGSESVCGDSSASWL